MSTPKLLLFYVAWLFAAGAMALTFAVVVTEVLSLVGIIDRSGSSYGLALNLITALTFVGLALIPFVFRHRFHSDSDDQVESV